MTNRYELYMDALRTTNDSVLKLFLFVVFALVAYASLTWLPVWMQRPARMFYLALALAAFIFVTVYSSRL